MSIDGIENIKEVFCIFHDGVIVSGGLTGGEMRLEVRIQYLAGRVDPHYRKFQVVLKGVENVRFITWPNDTESQPRVLRNIGKIFEPDLDILNGSVKEDHVHVVCSQPSPTHDYCGGELCFIAGQSIVTDEAGKSYSMEELDALARDYWDDWEKSSQKS